MRHLQAPPFIGSGIADLRIEIPAGRQAEAREAYTAFLRLAPPEAMEQIEQARSKIGRR